MDATMDALSKLISAFASLAWPLVLAVLLFKLYDPIRALVVDRQVWQRSGAMALRRLGERFEITTTRPLGYDRPWRRAIAPESDAPAPPRAMPPQPRDATPREDDLEAGD